MRTRISRFTHKKLTNMKLLWENFIALDNVLRAYFLFWINVMKLSIENDKKCITVEKYLYIVYIVIVKIWCDFDRASSIICGNKMPTRCKRWIFIAEVTACSSCFGHHYSHHQELESIIQVVAACRIWCLVFKLSVWCVAEGCVSLFAGCCFKATTCIMLSSFWWWA